MMIVGAMLTSAVPAQAATLPMFKQSETVTISREEYENYQRYQKLEALFQIVEAYYYEDVDEDAMLESAAAGLMAGIGDIYSVYYTKEEMEKFNEENAGVTRVYFMELDYRPRDFLEAVRGLEDEPEGGARCSVCFKQRLEKTAETASLSGYDYFGTTLTVSPHKNYKLISRIGSELALRYRLSFLDRDFKKKDGFRRSVELSKKYGLYRQNYCGCKYSNRRGDE